MEIRKVNTSELKFECNLLKIEHSIPIETPVIVDRELNVVFGDISALKSTEIEVIIIDLPFKETRLAMHSIGRWAEPNWTIMKNEDVTKYGYSAINDGFLFDEIPASINLPRFNDGSTGEELF